MTSVGKGQEFYEGFGEGPWKIYPKNNIALHGFYYGISQDCIQDFSNLGSSNIKKKLATMKLIVAFILKRQQQFSIFTVRSQTLVNYILVFNFESQMIHL